MIRSGSPSGITESNPPLGISNVEYRSLASKKDLVFMIRSGSPSGITESNPPLGISNVEYRSLAS